MALDPQKIGKTIAELRKRAGFSQKGLADRLFISDKAVSKWERGLSIPDIAYLGKLSVLLDVDIDTLLEGKHTFRANSWKGFLIAERTSAEISLLTTIFDKPLVYYMLSNFLLVGVDEILIACTKEEMTALQQLLGNGKKFGIHLSYTEKTPETSVSDIILSHASYFADSSIMTVFESSILFSASMTYLYQRAMLNHGQHTLLAIPATELPAGEKKLVFDDSKRVTAEAVLNTAYEYGYLPVLFSPGNLLIDDIRVSESADSVLDTLIDRGSVFVETANRGIIKISVLTQDDALEASALVRTLQNRGGSYVGCLEEIAWRRGLINEAQLLAAQENCKNTQYGDYLRKLGNHL